MGWARPGMKLDTSVNKTDDAGNSLMVNTYKNNLYCRVSCSENWQLSMQSFGNFVGQKAIAAGSYFQINDQDMFISGKRTCYTTFIDYGSIDGRGSGGFTNDVNIESDKIVDNYNHYSNLSHFYADIACQNDKEYSTVGGHTAECSYSEINLSARKFCYSYTTKKYCFTDGTGHSGGVCRFEVPAEHEYYCDAGDYFSSTESYNCMHDYTRTSSTSCAEWFKRSCLYKSTESEPDEENKCPPGKELKTYTNDDDESVTSCFTRAWVTTPAACDSGDIDNSPYNTSSKSCTHKYRAHDYWTCEESYYGEPGDDAFDNYYSNRTFNLYTPATAFEFELDRYGLHNDAEISTGMSLADSIGVQLDMDDAWHYEFHMCRYSYPMQHYNQCKSDGYGICINYYVSSSNKAIGGRNGIDDGDKTPDGAETGEGDYVKYTTISDDGKGNQEQKPVGEIAKYYGVSSRGGFSAAGLTTGTADTSALKGYAYENEYQASVEFANDTGTTIGGNTKRYAALAAYSKYQITDDPAKFCKGGSWSVVPEEGISYAAGGPEITDKGAVASGGSNVIITGLDSGEECTPSSMPNCVTKKGSGGYKSVYTFGNLTPSRFSSSLGPNPWNVSWDSDGNPVMQPKPPKPTGGTAIDLAGEQAQESAPDTVTPCDAGDNCDTARGVNVRKAFLDGMGITGKLDGYAQGMIAASTNINVYANDMFACQHFEMFNSTDEQNEERENNITWSTNFMGHTKSFVKIVSSFEPEVSYSYDEYMTILGNNNVMERFTELNDETWDKDNCYNIATRSGPGGCYNKATNQKVDTSINYYKNAKGDIESKPITLARNYTINYYYDNNNSEWANNSIEAKSYGEQGNPGNVLELKCSNGNCNIGDQLASPTGGSSGGNNKYKRAILCTIGLVMDKPTLATYTDGKSSGTALIYLNDKDYFWTAGTCYINQVQYLRANYVKASIENSSFYKNKGYWYVNTANDTKANGLTLRDALTNSNNNISSSYNIDAEEELGRWSILGNYNVFPIKLTTPRDLYQYTYTFANIGSYGDGELGRVMGRDQSLIVLNSRTCFYEVFEELCMCCGNPINAHVDSESPYIFASRDEVEYEMSNEDPGDITTSTLAITTSNVSLSDITSDTDRQLGDNWSEKSTFFFNGEDSFTTRKGADLLTKLESVGDNVYSEEPEYKFTLNPEGLSHIREYNDSHTYGVTYEDLISIGRYAMNPFYDETFLECDDITNSDCRWEVAITTDDDYYPQNRIINFTHFGSNFLMNELKGIKGVTFSGKYSDYSSIGMNESCYVLQTDSADITTELNKLSETCRWVDYVQKGTKEDGTTVDRYFRLSFK